MIARSILTALLLSATAASAEDWSGRFTLYGWLPSADLDTTIDRPGGGLSGGAAAGVDDILDALKFAAFATGEVRRGRFGLIGDLVYTDLGVDETGRFGVRRDIDLQLLMLTGAATWRVWDDGRGFIDALGGARLVSADVDLSRSGAVVTQSASKSTSWVDPLVGARVGYAATDKLSLTALANIGGFGVGSQLTWEVYAGASYAFTDRLSGDLGFRYLSIDYDSGGNELDAQLYGPAVGLTVRF